jgi:hypothetical protein
MEKTRLLLLTIVQDMGGELRHHLDRRLARALLSQFCSREIDPNDFRHILDISEEEGLIEVDKNSKNVKITREGLTVLTLSMEDNQARIIRSIIKSYLEKTDTEKELLVNEILDAISKETQYFERRVQDFSEFDAEYGTNGFLGQIRFKKNIDWLSFSSIGYVQEKDFRSKLKYVDRLSEIFLTANCIIKPREKSIEVILFEPSDWEGKIATAGFQLTQKRLNIAPFDLDDDLMEFLIREFLKKHLFSKKLMRVGITEKFVDFSRSHKLNTRIGTVRCFEGFNMGVEIKKNFCMVWIDPSKLQMYTLMDCIKFLKLTYSEKDIDERLREAKIHVLPKRSEAYIKNIIHNQDMKTFGNFDYVQYWKTKYNMEIERNQAIVNVSFGQTFSRNYPSDTIYLDKKEIEKRVGYWKEKEALALEPSKRVEKVRAILSDYFTEDRVEIAELFELSITKKMPSWRELNTYGFSLRTIRVLPPSLVFSKDLRNTSYDPRAIFKFGPYAAKRDIFVWKIFVPIEYSESQVQSFIELVGSAYNQHQFGRVLYEPDKLIQRIPRELYGTKPKKDVLRNIIRNIPKPDKDKLNVAIILMPNEFSPLYNMAKVAINEELNIPDQLIRENTFWQIAEKGNYSLAKTLALQLFIKSLKDKEEVPWILARPSDGKGKTVYIGFGFSREPTTKKEANSFFAVCDSVGKAVIQKTIGIPFKGRYIDSAWLTDFFDSVRNELEKLSISRFERLVVYRTGTMYANERKALDEWLSSQKTDSYWGNVLFDFISVKPTLKRIFKFGETTSNPETGICLILNQNEALLNTSSIHERKLSQGTVIPVHIVKETKTATEIHDIVKEYHDRTYLNWMAPITGCKWPLELHIANNLAEIARYTTREFSYIYV